VGFPFSRHEEKIQSADNRKCIKQADSRKSASQPSIRSETGQQVAKPTQMKKSSAKRNASNSASNK